MKKVLTIVGARPQFIKAAAVSRVIRDEFSDSLQESIVHTGQHFDANMSDVFFDELGIPTPKYNLNIGGGSHGSMTGKMLSQIEKVLFEEKPDWVMIYGDTNSTLAGALAAAKLHTPIAHIEAGLRSFNMKMPEEINRVLSDRVSSLLLCPTEAAVNNLAVEGIVNGVHNVGDVMFDSSLLFREKANAKSRVLERLGLKRSEFILVTCHRAENTNDSQRLKSIFMALAEISVHTKVVLPIHPRTRNYIEELGLSGYLRNIVVTDPLPFLDMLMLEQNSRLILTDSGGVQKEAFFFNIPCITMRDETEWVETVDLGWNVLVGADCQRILDAVSYAKNGNHAMPYGDGRASQKIAQLLAGD